MLKDREFCVDFIDMFFLNEHLLLLGSMKVTGCHKNTISSTTKSETRKNQFLQS